MLPPADITEVAPGLWRWTARHPQWAPGAKRDSPADWPREVGSIAYAAPGALLLVDPLVPEGADGLWSWLDERAGRQDGRVEVMTTIAWHDRSRAEVVARYGAGAGEAPEGVEPVEIAGADETMVWLPAVATLVPGDRLIADGRGGLRLCPASWLRYLDDPPHSTSCARPSRPCSSWTFGGCWSRTASR
jgi:hypothetical protein